MPLDNDLIPSNSISPVQSFLEKINLPEMIAGPAGKAISRLVAGVVEIPAAFLDGFAQSIKNKTEARKVVSTEVATAAAKLAANDSDIVARAAHNLLAKEYRHQKNKEEIAKKTIEILVHDTAQHSESKQNQSTSTQAPPPPPPDVDEDWLNVFEKFAEDASTDRMQTLWARVLAGEIRSPKTFSLKTLRFVSELDQETARIFEKYLPLVCGGSFLPIPEPFQGLEFSEMMHLQDAGLIAGVGGMVQQTFNLTKNLPIGIFNQGRVLLIESNSTRELRFSCALLTKIGIELSRIIQLPFSESELKKVIDRIPKDGIKSIALLGFSGNPNETLWQKPENPDATTG
jgi:hypothetical protein